MPPVVVLKLIPGGVALIVNLEMAPPVELMVKPVAAVFFILVSVDDERVKAGAVGATVKVKVLAVEPEALVAVIV